MREIPRERGIDSTLSVLREGYTFISSRCDKHDSSLFRTRILLRDTICMRGEAAARLFYDETRFRREGAAPGRLQKVLTGRGGVQGLDGTAHRVRKQMFMSLMTPDALEELVQLHASGWDAAIRRWERERKVQLHQEVREILCRSVCRWAGVPLEEAEVARLTSDLGAMIDGPASLGWGYVRGRFGRLRSERWAGQLIERARRAPSTDRPARALQVIARHRDADGELLDRHTAAVELLNVLRPVVAVARFITFAALEIWKHPEWRDRLAHDDEAVEEFAQEVRRVYAFFPFIAAVTRESFEWEGYRFPKDARVLLDLYGTNRDPDVWEAPNEFRPERFRQWNESAYNFITQGGGDHHRHHRCAGEWISIELTKVGIKALTRSMTYAVPSQNLQVDLAPPMLPRSGFIIDTVRQRPGAHAAEVAVSTHLSRPSREEMPRVRAVGAR